MFNNNTQWKVKVEDSIGTAQVKIWLYHEQDGAIHVARVYADTTLITEKIDNSIEVAPTMTIPRMAWDAIVEAFKDQETTYHEKEVDAELKATKYHLEDMRKLVLYKKV